MNALVGQRRLAHVSRTPGRTRGLAFFEIEGRYAFVDLPGYGYAKVSRDERDRWKTLVEGYLSSCRLLRKVYLLLDARRGPGEEEQMLSSYLATHGIPFRWIGTKADKLSAAERSSMAARLAGPEGPGIGEGPLLVSARTREGIELLWRDVRAAFSA